MLPHPILATENDKDYIKNSILCLPERAERFFTMLERIYLEGKRDETHQAHAVYHSIQSTLKVLEEVSSKSYRKDCAGLPVNAELHDRLLRMQRLFLEDLVDVGPEALAWKSLVMRLAQEAADSVRNTRIKFPQHVIFMRQCISLHSIWFRLLILAFVCVAIGNGVMVVCMSYVRPSSVIGLPVGLLWSFFLALFGSFIIYFYVTAARALQKLYDFSLADRMYASIVSTSSFLQNEGILNGASGTLQIRRGQETEKGYYAIPCGNAVGYIEGKYVDTQVVMIGFNDDYLITRWDIAAELMTGFIECVCIGKPLSDLVITPSGDVSADLSRLKASKGGVMKVKLQALATAPVTLFTIVAPVLDVAGETIGSMLICANAKDDCREYRSYIRDYLMSEINVSLSRLTEKEAVRLRGPSEISSLRAFLECATEKHVEELAREMLTEWEWTTAERLLGRVLMSSAIQHRSQVDFSFPCSLCLHPRVPNTISALLAALGVPCLLKLEMLNPTGNIFVLSVTIFFEKNNNRFYGDLWSTVMQYLRSTCGKMYNDDCNICLHFPSQVTFILDGADDSSFKDPDVRCEQSIIGQARAIFNCTVNVLTLITNLVDQHNLSMILLKTMFVSLTSVRERDDLEQRLKASPCDVDVIVCDREWLYSARELIFSLDRGIIVVPIVDSKMSFSSEGFQHVIHTPISGSEVRKVLMGVGTAVSLRKNAATAQEERERILTLRQDSPWTKGRLLGRGSFGAVYEATSDLTGGKMAVKMFYFSVDHEQSINKLVNEIKIMCSLNHPNIVHYFHCERKDNSVNLFMELCDASLGDVIVGKVPKPASLTVLQILRQVLTALAYLHARGVAHRDVKPQNILLKGDTVKITDFGTAREGKASKDVQGTLRYMAPEVYRGESHSSPCDIWSIGCLACELFACPLKFMENSLLLAEYTSVAPYLENVTNSVTLNDFLLKCFHQDPEKRPTAANLLLHSLFSSACGSEVEKLPTVFFPGHRKSFVFSISSQRE